MEKACSQEESCIPREGRVDSKWLEPGSNQVGVRAASPQRPRSMRGWHRLRGI